MSGRRGLVGAVSVLAALALPAAASSHVVVQPAFLADGEHATLIFTAPNEHPPHAMTELTVTAPPKTTLSRRNPPPGWELTVSGRSAVWSGGRAGPGPAPTFALRATTDATPGATTFDAMQRYDDGRVVRWSIAFTILPASKPAPKQHLWPALLAGGAGLVAIGGGLAFAFRRQRQAFT